DARGVSRGGWWRPPLGSRYTPPARPPHAPPAARWCTPPAEATIRAWDVLRWPVGILLAVLATSAIFRLSPRRAQPGYTWLAFGAVVHLVLWLGATWALSLYVGASSSFTSVYGPLSAIMSLLLWSYLTSLALFLGLSFAAQLEAVRAGTKDPVARDPGV
ncbi:YihY/virulence factor BrkB family protein, partial [Streptomyces erythrochromogenes]|uniref:YihY/virulence factor BrkB family protein n=1 Tax=Streptomyces erythrochromogenes TaxID=285574 RepID=UPI0036837AC5